MCYLPYYCCPGSEGSVTSEQKDEWRKDVGRILNHKVDVSRLQGILRKGKDQKEVCVCVF